MKFTTLRAAEVVILLLFTVVLIWLFSFHIPHSIPDHEEKSQIVVIPPGRSVRNIGLILKEKGIISHAPLFVVAVKLWGKEGSLQAGRYTFPPRNSIASVIRKLTEGEMEYARVTIPEGLNAYEMAGKFQAEAGIDSQRFIDLVHDLPFIKSLGIEADALEGYLFPNTYIVYFEMDPGDVIKRMTDAFRTVFTEKDTLRARELGFTVEEVLTLASIIEKEAKLSLERPVISAVYHNRLKLGRPLEADPTVQYALGIHKPRLLEEDLKVKSPYNTYLHAGLPPGPICSPSRASIEAALYPAKVDYLYFVAQGDGGHAFSHSLEQHVQAKFRAKRANNHNAK
jgi:UPF0755 protein